MTEEQRKSFSLRPRLRSCIEFCIRDLPHARRDAYALQVLRELWGIQEDLGERGKGIIDMCVNIGTLGVEGEAKDIIVNILDGVPGVPEPQILKACWLIHRLEILCIMKQ